VRGVARISNFLSLITDLNSSDLNPVHDERCGNEQVLGLELFRVLLLISTDELYNLQCRIVYQMSREFTISIDNDREVNITKLFKQK